MPTGPHRRAVLLRQAAPPGLEAFRHRLVRDLARREFRRRALRRRPDGSDPAGRLRFDLESKAEPVACHAAPAGVAQDPNVTAQGNPSTLPSIPPAVEGEGRSGPLRIVPGKVSSGDVATRFWEPHRLPAHVLRCG